MKTTTKIAIGVGFTVLAIGAWVGAKTFTGNELGAECNGDGDCKGMSSACLISGNEKYCTLECTDNTSCPPQWICGDVTVTNIDGSGNMTPGGTTRLCARPSATVVQPVGMR